MFPNMWEKIGQEVQTSKPSTSFLDYALLFLLIGHGGRMSSAVRFELWKFGVLQESNGDCNSNTPSLVACPSTLLYLTLDTKSLCFLSIGFVDWGGMGNVVEWTRLPLGPIACQCNARFQVAGGLWENLSIPCTFIFDMWYIHMKWILW